MIWEGSMEQTIMMVMQTSQTFTEKSKTHTLTEYEALMYEQCCNMVATFCKIQDAIGRIQLLKIEQAEYAEQQAHDKWVRERDASTDQRGRDSSRGDEGTDPEGGCSGVPA